MSDAPSPDDPDVAAQAKAIADRFCARLDVVLEAAVQQLLEDVIARVVKELDEADRGAFVQMVREELAGFQARAVIARIRYARVPPR